MTIAIQPISTQTPTLLHIGRHLLDEMLLPNLLSEFDGSAVLIADRNLKDILAEKLAEKLNIKVLYVEGGESAKTRESKEKLEDALLKKGYGRDTLLIGLGGGTITDLVGFLASTYLRGIPLILIPTSLLAMVDASIGGKTAINTPFGKNQIGTLYHPQAILIDLEVLHTLPMIELKNGLAEILKIGLIANPDLFVFLNDFEKLIPLAIEEKIKIIEKDPTETGLRRILNFGHTIGHALEKISNYTLSHGRAVAMGCVLESYLSMQLGYLSKESFQTIQTLYEPYLPFHLPPNYNREEFLKILSLDKKNKREEIRFVLIGEIGKALSFDGNYCRSVLKADIENLLFWMETMYG